MIPTRTLGVGSWWSDEIRGVNVKVASPHAVYLVKEGRVFRARDGWVVRPANEFSAFDIRSDTV